MPVLTFHDRFYTDAQNAICTAKCLRMRWQANDFAANEQQDQSIGKHSKSAAALQKQGITKPYNHKLEHRPALL